MSEFAIDRGAGDAEHDLAAAQERDLRREERILAHEGLGAVDGIDQPYALRRQVPRIGLLSIKAVCGEVRLEDFPDRPLAAYVRLGNGGPVRLDAHLDVARIKRPRDVRRSAGGLECGLELG